MEYDLIFIESNPHGLLEFVDLQLYVGLGDAITNAGQLGSVCLTPSLGLPPGRIVWLHL